MKNTNLSLFNLAFLLSTFIAAVLLYSSCHKCKLLDQVITPVEEKCEGTFYILNAEESMGFVFSLHEFIKTVPEPFQSQSLAGPFNLQTSFFNTRSNFSAYDSIGRRYVFQHHYDMDQFFSIDLVSGQSTHTQRHGIDVCPVFHKGRLHSIYVEQNGPDEWFYSINEINPVSGIDGVGLIGNSIVTNSPMPPEYMSAVSTGGDLFYFLSGTNLIEVNLMANTTRHIDIDPTYNSIDNIVYYYGLEYKKDTGVLLAMKNSTNFMTNELTTTLVSIRVTSGAPVLTTLFNISSGMSNLLEHFVNPEFYSSTFDPCDNTYYATVKQGGFDINTSFIEINLPKKEMKLQTLEGFWYGLEYINK